MNEGTGALLVLLAFAAWMSSGSGSSSSSRHSWRTNSFGGVELDGSLPLLDPKQGIEWEKHVRQWRELAHAAAEGTGIPVPWVLGVIFAESRGNPEAKSPAGAIGLMQLHSREARAGLPDETLVDPATNILLGTQFLARIKRPGDQLPEVASKYNAGMEANGRPHPSKVSSWGMREQPGYIETVVRASNYAAGLGVNG